MKEWQAGPEDEEQLTSRAISTQHSLVQIPEIRYGIIRSQALDPEESLAFIEKMLGEP